MIFQFVIYSIHYMYIIKTLVYLSNIRECGESQVRHEVISERLNCSGEFYSLTVSSSSSSSSSVTQSDSGEKERKDCSDINHVDY